MITNPTKGALVGVAVATPELTGYAVSAAVAGGIGLSWWAEPVL